MRPRNEQVSSGPRLYLTTRGAQRRSGLQRLRSCVGLNIFCQFWILLCAFDLQRKDSSGSDHGVADADRMLAQAFADFVDREHAGTNINIINLCLFEGIESAVLLPDKLDIGEAKVASNDEIDGVSQVAEDRHQAFRGGLLHAGFSSSAVHDADKLLWRETKGITDYASDPFVERVFQHGIARELEVAAFGNKSDATAAGGVPGQSAIKPFLKFADLVSRPFLGDLGQRFRHIALSVVIQQMNLAAKADVDGENDLLDRREAEKLMRAHVAGTIDELVSSEVHCGQALEDLLVRDGRRCRRASHGVNLARDSRAINDFQGIKSFSVRP